MIVSCKKFFVGRGNIVERFLRSLDCYRNRRRFQQVFGFRANPEGDSVKVARENERIVRELSTLGKRWLSLKDAYRRALSDYRFFPVAPHTANHRWSAKCRLRVMGMEAFIARRKFFGACPIPKLVGYAIDSGPENYVPVGRKEDVLYETVIFYGRCFPPTPKRSFQ